MRDAVLGFLMFCVYWLRFGGTYRAKQAFYRAALDGDPTMVRFLTGIFGSMALDYRYALSNKNRDRINPAVLEDYRINDADHWYNETHKDVRNSGGRLIDIEEQQRGLVIPEIKFALERLEEDRTHHAKRIVTLDVGCADGLLACYVAGLSRDIESRAIDLSLAGTGPARRTGNVKFFEGYLPDIAEQNPGDFEDIDLLYCTSMMCLLLPREVGRFVALFKRLRVKMVAISEPMWAGFQPTGAAAASHHLESRVWFHDYLGYFAAEGYCCLRSRCDPYVHPISERPDIRVFVGTFSLS